MRINYFLAIIALFTLTLAGCSKSDDNVSPATTSSPADLLVRTWVFNDVSVQTDAKKYKIPAVLPTGGGLFGDENVLVFKKDGTFTAMVNKVPKTGKWALQDKKLTLTDLFKGETTWTVNTLSANDLAFSTIAVDLRKGKSINDSKAYSAEEGWAGEMSLLLLTMLDKNYGGTIDFSKEPEPKSVQLLVNGKAK
ncbi:hypothetical protein [Spirosoma rhododendri]|uniref:Lipocalin-like domain-containing protein n=1 Tax=Spirosoma rhododendri TaxID=2728024 RepID=A0A7L5DL80_9BACT|nr:hypothetical protein [Spirosoma rhododendri]QJD78845.1 hypothetical protein HH216_10700 [Spirosoma rhododendri]